MLISSRFNNDANGRRQSSAREKVGVTAESGISSTDELMTAPVAGSQAESIVLISTELL